MSVFFISAGRPCHSRSYLQRFPDNVDSISSVLKPGRLVLWAKLISCAVHFCSAVLDGQLYANSRRHWSSTSALCHSAEVDRTALPTERIRSLAFCCCGPVDLEFAAWQPSWPRAESQHFQASNEDIHFYQILMTKRTKCIRDFWVCAL